MTSTLKGVAGFNQLSPYGRIVKYVPAAKSGFYLLPASNSNPSGWGKPIIDSEGTYRLPGTPGGPDPVKFLAKPPGGDWAITGVPGSQLYGNIDWRGPQIDVHAPEKGRHRLTYHGPFSRQFPAANFTYGSDPKHNNVYYGGKCIAVAPLPVLGAAMKVGTDESLKLVVVCKDGQSDLVFIRPFPIGGVTANEYTDEWRLEQQERYNLTTKPDGWINIGVQTPTTGTQGNNSEIQAARTPWFFNEAGTEAQTVRECSISVFRGDINVTHLGFNRYRVNVSDQSSVFQDLRNHPPYVTTVTTKRTPQPILQVLTKYPKASSPDLTHHWEAFSIYQTIEMRGRQIIGVDYDGDRELLVEAVHNTYKSVEQWFYRGVDEDYDASYLGSNSDYSNQDDFYGDLWNTPNIGDRYPGDGRLSLWFDNREDLRLIVDDEYEAPLHRIVSGDKDKFFTGTTEEKYGFLYFWWFGRAYPHFLDARYRHVSFQFDYEVEQDTSLYFEYEEEYYNTGDMEDDVKFMVRPFEGVDTGDYGIPGVDAGWKNEDVDNEYPETIDEVHEFQGYDGVLPGPGSMALQFAADFPDPLEAYTPSPPVWGERVPLHQLLTDGLKAVRSGGHGVDDFGNRIVSMAYLDHANDLKYYNSLNGDVGKLTALAKSGTRFYPIGVS